MTEKIPVCPDCDTAALFPRSGKHTGESGWMCSDCKELKTSVVYRDRRGEYGYAPGTLAHKLAHMSADDV